jgi:hypothetical protein
MSEQVMRENFAAVSGDSKGSVVQNEHEQVLQKLHQDSLMSEGAKTAMMGAVIATETLTRAPFAATVARAIPPLGLSVSVLAGAGTINDAFQAVEAEEVKKESALIKEAFGPKFAPGAIAKIESECSVSTLRKAAVYGMGTLSEGSSRIWQRCSALAVYGWVLSPCLGYRRSGRWILKRRSIYSM